MIVESCREINLVLGMRGGRGLFGRFRHFLLRVKDLERSSGASRNTPLHIPLSFTLVVSRVMLHALQ